VSDCKHTDVIVTPEKIEIIKGKVKITDPLKYGTAVCRDCHKAIPLEDISSLYSDDHISIGVPESLLNKK
jgi:hypothetical protein